MTPFLRIFSRQRRSRLLSDPSPRKITQVVELEGHLRNSFNHVGISILRHVYVASDYVHNNGAHEYGQLDGRVANGRIG